MSTPALYDLTPALRLMGLGVVLALGPLAWVWLRHPGASLARRLQTLTVLTLFLTFDLVLFGAFTRLSDSGLGCPDWPGCYGQASPAGAHAEISAAQQALPSGPVTHGKAWVEMVHRYLATGVGVLILTLTLASWIAHRRVRREMGTGGETGAVHPGWPTATLLWVSLQGAFGALTVTMKLFPAIVTLHLLGGLGLLVLLCVQAVRHQQAAGASTPEPLAPRWRLALWGALALVLLQVALGGWVSTNYAVLACGEFPTCQGGWWPAMDFRQGFTFWRALGRTPQGEPIAFAALTAIHYTHRLSAYLVFAVLAGLAIGLQRAGVLGPQRRWLVGLVLWQLASGLTNVVLDWPLPAALAHTGGAAALVLVLTWALCASGRSTETELQSAPAAPADARRSETSRRLAA